MEALKKSAQWALKWVFVVLFVVGGALYRLWGVVCLVLLYVAHFSGMSAGLLAETFMDAYRSQRGVGSAVIAVFENTVLPKKRKE